MPVTGVPVGAVLGYGSTNYSAKTGWFVVGTTVYLFDHQAGGAVTACTGSLAQTPTAPVAGVISGPSNLYLTSQGDGSYVVNLATNTVTRIPNAAGGKVINLYNLRLVVGNLGGVNTNRVTFSDPYAPGGNPQFLWPGAQTTIAAGSNAVALPTATINVASTAAASPALDSSLAFTATGTIRVVTSTGVQTVTYTGITATSFTGCSGGTGTMSTGGVVDQPNYTYFDCGDAEDVNALLSQRTHMAVGKQDSWWVYQGEPGLNAVLRRAVNTDGPKEPLHAVLSRNGSLWFVPIFYDLPANFNGSIVNQARNLRFAKSSYTVSTLPPSFGAQAMAQLNDVFLVAGAANTGGPNMFAEMHNGAWAFHPSGVALSGYTGFGGGNGVYLCDGGSSTAAAKFYVYPTELDRPVKLGDTYGTTQDGATPAAGNTANSTYVELPEWESRDGSEVVVRAVLVGFKKWNTGFTQTNHLDCQVISTRQFQKSGVAANGLPAQGQVSALQSWDEAPSVTTSDGQYQEWRFEIGDQTTGNGFKLVFQNMRGVAIQKIQVIVDLLDTRV